MSIKCPECGLSDKIEKISGIYAGGISKSVFFGRNVGVSTPIGKGQSHVSSGFTSFRGSNQTLLSEFLTPPKKPRRNFLSWLIIFPLSGMFFSLFTLPDGPIIGGVLLLLSISLMWGLIKVINYDERNYKKNKLKVWENAMRRWNSLYYCYRNDVLFNPETEETFPIGAMMDYLYENK